MPLAKDLNALTNQPSPDIIPSNELWSDEPQLETHLHLRQILILLTCLEWWWRERSDFFASGNISIYYEKRQVEQKSHRFRGPDFFVILNTHPEPRKSWVVWEEDNRFPNLIVEILSKSTAKTDKTTKKTLYQDTFKTPEYFWFHPNTLEFAGFRLIDGKYQPIAANSQGWLWSEELGLFLGIRDRQLRYFTQQGELVPIPAEQLESELRERELAQQQAQTERRERELAQQQAQTERRERELAQQQAQTERRERELAQQQLADMEALLARYRERFGELPD